MWQKPYRVVALELAVKLYQSRNGPLIFDGCAGQVEYEAIRFERYLFTGKFDENKDESN